MNYEEFAIQLLELAGMMANVRYPRQTTLRRAVSTAYYALFHRLIDCATSEIVSVNYDLKLLAARAFEHKGMKEICAAFGSSRLPPLVLPAMPNGPLSPQLQNVANLFCKLQELRHRADYDVSAKQFRPAHGLVANKFNTANVRQLLLDVADAFKSIAVLREAAPGTPMAEQWRVFLTLTPLWEAMRRR